MGGVDDDDAGDESVTVTLTASGGDYGGETAEVAVSVSDGDTAALVVDPDSLTISENGSGTFEVSLATRPSAQVSVTVSSGDTGAVSVSWGTLLFTTGNWSTARSVTVSGVDDADALDESVTVTLTASAGDYNGVTAEVDVSVTDGDTAALVVDPDSLSISENGSGTFLVSLATRPSSSVSVSVSSGDTGAVSVPSRALTFTTGNWSTAQSVAVGGVDDDDALDESVTVTVAASGGDYGGVTAEVDVSVTDGDTAKLVVDPDSLSVAEGGSGTFFVRLATRPSSSVSVSVSSGDTGAVSVPSRALTFTTGNWSTAQSVAVSGVDDDDAGDESVTVTLTASGGDYGGRTAEVDVSVADGDTAGLVVDPDSLSISENGSGTFEVSLATRPSARVSVSVSSGDTGAVSVGRTTLTFTTGNWSTAQSVAVGGVVDADALDESVTVTLTASGGDYGGETAEVAVTVDDVDMAMLVVDPDSLTISEDGSGTFEVSLATRPSAQVSVTVSSGDSGAVSVSWGTLLFTTGDWSTARSVTVGGVDDADADDELVTVTLTASAGDYGGVAAEVDVSVTDDDTAELVVDPDSLSISEDGSGNVSVSLATRPSASVSVRVSSGDADAVSVPSQAVVFTTGNWSTARSVTVEGVDDADALDELVTVTLTASGGDYGGETATVAVSVADDDTVNLVVDPGSLPVSEDGSGTFSVRLATRPSAQVSVTVSSGDAGAVSVPARAVVFTTGNWSTAQSVTVSGVDDDDAGDESVTVTLRASGGDYGGETATVSVSVADDDDAALVVDPDSLTVAEGGSGTFEVSLATRPSVSVSVRVSSGDPGAVSVPVRALVFTTGNWSTAQSVTVGGVDDDDAGDESVTVTVTAAGGDYGGVTAEVDVSVTDGDTAALVVDPDSLTVSEDGSGTFEVSLATRPSASVSVTVSSGDAGAVSVPSQAVVFTTGDWSTAQLVAVGGVDDDDAGDELVTVTVTAYGGDYGGVTAEVEVSVSDGDTAGLVVDPDSLTVSEDGSGTFEVRLATRPSAQVSVTVSSGDAGAVSVPSQAVVFTTGNWSTAQLVTVEGVDDDDAGDELVTVTVTASGGDYGGETAEVEVAVTDGDTVELVVDPGSQTISENGSGTFSVRLATRPSAQVSVTVSSGDAGAVSVRSQAVVFTTGNWSTAQSVAVGGVDDEDALDESVTVTVTASGGDYSGETVEVEVAVSDDDTVNLVVDPGSLPILEGGSGSFEVSLATRPSAQVSVTVSSGDTGAVSVGRTSLTFTTGNWSTAQSVAVGGVIDADALDESVTVTLTASGADYGGETAEVEVSVSDGHTAALVVDPDSLTVAEGGSGNFSVRLATRPSASVSVTVSSGDSGAVSVPARALVFTTGDWSTAQSVTVEGVDDDDALGESVTVTLTASGGDYGGETAEVDVSVTDGDTVNLVVDPGSLPISEDGSGTFEVSLATRPSAQVSVSVSSGDTGAVSVPARALVFTTGNWSTAQSVTVEGVDDDDALDESVTVTVTASGGDYNGETAEVEVSVSDDETAELVVDPDSLPISEDGSGNFEVSLASRPSASVSVRVSSGDSGAVSVPSRALVFTTGNWSTAQSVTVEGVNDDDALDESVTVTLTASGGDYGGETAEVEVSVSDDETAELVVDPDSLTISEDGSGNFELSLATRPSAQVSVRVSSGDSGAVSVSWGTLLFTTGNWSTARSVTVSGVDDNDALDESVTVTVTASAGDYNGVTAEVDVSVADDDTAELVLDRDSLSISEDGSGTFSVRLATRPSSSVSVRVSSGDAGAVSVPAQAVVFTTGNWSKAQLVSVGGVDDEDALDESVTVTVTASGGDYGGVTAEVEVSVADGDTAGLVVDPDSLTVAENGSGTFSVRLATRPSSSVSVRVSSGDTGAVSVPSRALTFTTGNWSTARTVSVSGVDDDDALDESVTVTVTASGGDYGGVTATVAVSVTDDDTVNLEVDPGSLPISENGSGTFELRLATRPSAQVSVRVSSGDSGAVSVSWGTLLFTTGNWSTARSVTVSGVDDADALDESVTVTLTASGADYGGETAEVEVSVSDDDTAALVVDPDSLTISEDGSGTFELRLATRPSHSVSVTVSSADTGAVSVLTGTLTFTTGDWSTAQSVTVSGVDDADALDESVTVTLTASGGDYSGSSISGGPDMNKFSVDFNGILSMTITPNFEDPQDANRDNNYEVAIRVSSGPGGGQPDRHASADFSVAITDRTDEAPGAPDLWTLSEERTELKVGWSEPLNDGPSINAYTVRIRQTPHGSFVELPVSANAMSHTWRGLNPATLYLVQVRAENNEGRGPWTRELYALTDDCSQSTTNACPLAVGVSDRGIINVDLTADKDWFEIILEANHLYRIDVEGFGIDVLGDPEVRVYDSSGDSIAGAYDNDDGPGLDARLLFEPASNDTYYIEVVEHGGDGVGWYEVTVAVTDSPPRILGTRSLFLEENATLRHQVTATDNDPGHAITGFSISGGPDMAKFAINANGILSMTIEPDHEAPEDADDNNTYEVMVTATSGPGGGVADRQTTADFSVAIDDVDEPPDRPGAPTVTATRKQLNFAWDEPDNSGQATDLYEIRLAERGTSNWTSVTVAAAALAYSWETLTVGTWYEYQVRAINDEGLSNWTTVASVATDDCTDRTRNACSVTVGGSATGLIGVDTKVGKPDRDWFRVSLEANVALRVSGRSEGVEEGPVGFAGVEQGPDSVVGEVGEPEGGAFDAFDQVVGCFGGCVGDSGGVPVGDLVSPVPDGAAQPVDLWWHGGVLEVLGELVDGGGAQVGVVDVVDASEGLFGVPGVADLAVGVAGVEQAPQFGVSVVGDVLRR